MSALSSMRHVYHTQAAQASGGCSPHVQNEASTAHVRLVSDDAAGDTQTRFLPRLRRVCAAKNTERNTNTPST